MISESIEKLISSLEQVSKQKREMQSKDAVLMMSTKFVDMVEKSTDTTSLSKAMLKANRMAMSMGMPELAQQVNNLGQIKQAEFLHGQSERIKLEKANLYKNIYGDTEILYNNEYIKLNSTKEFQDIQYLDPEVQQMAYEGLAKKYKTDLVNELDISDRNNPILKTYNINAATGEYKLYRKYSRTSSGMYDDLMTKDEIDQMQEPIEITRYMNELNLQKEQRNYAASMRNMDLTQPKPTQVRIVGDDGQERDVAAYWIAKDNKYYSYADNKDITKDMVSTKTYKNTESNGLRNSDVTMKENAMKKSGQELFNQIYNRGFITDEVFENYEKVAGKEAAKSLKTNIMGYTTGSFTTINPLEVIKALSLTQPTNDKTKSWLDELATKDKVIATSLMELRNRRYEYDKTLEKRSKEILDKTGTTKATENLINKMQDTTKANTMTGDDFLKDTWGKKR